MPCGPLRYHACSNVINGDTTDTTPWSSKTRSSQGSTLTLTLTLSAATSALGAVEVWPQACCFSGVNITLHTTLTNYANGTVCQSGLTQANTSKLLVRCATAALGTAVQYITLSSAAQLSVHEVKAYMYPGAQQSQLPNTCCLLSLLKANISMV